MMKNIYLLNLFQGEFFAHSELLCWLLFKVAEVKIPNTNMVKLEQIKFYSIKKIRLIFKNTYNFIFVTYVNCLCSDTQMLSVFPSHRMTMLIHETCLINKEKKTETINKIRTYS